MTQRPTKQSCSCDGTEPAPSNRQKQELAAGTSVTSSLCHQADKKPGLHSHNQRNAVFELRVHGLVMPHFHATPGSNASTNDGKQKQCRFRNTAFSLFGLKFINAIHHERDDIDSNYAEQKQSNHGYPMRLSYEVLLCSYVQRILSFARPASVINPRASSEAQRSMFSCVQ